MDGGYGDTGREVGTDCWSRCCVLPAGIEIANRPLQVQYMTLLRVHVSGGQYQDLLLRGRFHGVRTLLYKNLAW